MCEDDTRGLSPRVRGNPGNAVPCAQAQRSIPAGAGEPVRLRDAVGVVRVYPRGCGGTHERALGDRQPAGLSPRVRGNPPHAGREGDPSRSIPAGAGEPRVDAWQRGGDRVYPRGCGGTVDVESRRRGPPGLSPRVRGNPHVGQRGGARIGSIPAGAGEPRARWRWSSGGGVYPRGCGGTCCVFPCFLRVRGLSPRVRGNRVAPAGFDALSGSIPAGAGEPPRSRQPRSECRVYPRGCGGTRELPGPGAHTPGLSPRVRGNQCFRLASGDGTGSIPAGAGEPNSDRRISPRSWVYPRGCGGTGTEACVPSCSKGLSPRVRGNRTRSNGTPSGERSIPAGAGEPAIGPHSHRVERVYPRGCGGTFAARLLRLPAGGLSPRVRGNQLRHIVDRFGDGSIPAGAGEPSGRTTATS